MRSFCGLMVLTCTPLFSQAGQTGAAGAVASGGAVRPGTTSAPELPKADVKPEDKCTVEGSVVNALTGELLKKAHLNLRPIGQQDAATYGSDTDGAGHFTFEEVDPGRYTLSATRNGFVNQAYSPQGNTKRSSTLTLANGQKLKGIVFKMTPHGIISGRVLDQDGDPMARVQIMAMTFAYPRGKKQLMPSGSGSSNDLGEFRIFGLRPGRYILSATYQSPNSYMLSSERMVGANQSEEGYATTYYPNTPSPDNASQIEVTAGGQIQGLTMTLAHTRTVRIRGHVVSGPANQARRNVMIQLMPRGNTFFGPMRNMARVLDSKGTFEMRGVTPGSYYLWGNYSDDSGRFSARVPIDVGDTNIDGIEVSFQPPAEITGRIIVEENGDLKGAMPNVYLQPKVDGPMMGGAGGQLKDDLTFKMTNVTPDPYDVNVFGLPEGFYVKGVRMGEQDVTLTGVDFTQGVPAASMTVVLNPNGGQVEGTVQNAKGENAAGAMVTLIPDESHRVSWLYKTANTDQNGHFTIKGVRPGQYKIYAWEEIENGAYQDPDYVKPHESSGQSVNISENGQQTVQLSAISAEDSGPSGRK